MNDDKRAVDSRLTPYDDAYATCERTCVRLCIYGNDLDPAVVSTRLELAPSYSQKKGDEHVNSLGRRRAATGGVWILSSEPEITSRDVRRHLDWLVARIQPAAAALRGLQATPGVTMTVDCVWWSATGGGGPTLWPEQMKALADLNLECSFDVSFFGSDDEEVEENQIAGA